MTDIRGSKILVTGGSGLIGSHTVDKLIKRDVEKVIVFDKYINHENLAKYLNSNKVEIIQGDIFDIDRVKSSLEALDRCCTSSCFRCRILSGHGM